MLPTSARCALPVINPASIPAPNPGLNVFKVRPSIPLVAGAPKIRPQVGFAKTEQIDPMTQPGIAVSNHMHDFFGNSDMTKDSTDATVAVGKSTSKGGTANRTSYWTPTFVDSRTDYIVPFRNSLVYYLGGGGAANDFARNQIAPFPRGLRMIAGNSAATTLDPLSKASFYCSGGTRNGVPMGNYIIAPIDGVTMLQGQDSLTIPDCYAGSNVVVKLFFPSCWTGLALDSIDHKSHMAYVGTGDWETNPSQNKCPTSHPVKLPEIVQDVTHLVVNDHDSRFWRLSSDNYSLLLPGGYSMHGNIWEMWDDKIMGMIVNNVIRPSMEGGGQYLGADPDTGINMELY